MLKLNAKKHLSARLLRTWRRNNTISDFYAKQKGARSVTSPDRWAFTGEPRRSTPISPTGTNRLAEERVKVQLWGHIWRSWTNGWRKISYFPGNRAYRHMDLPVAERWTPVYRRTMPPIFQANYFIRTYPMLCIRLRQFWLYESWVK